MSPRTTSWTSSPRRRSRRGRSSSTSARRPTSMWRRSTCSRRFELELGARDRASAGQVRGSVRDRMHRSGLMATIGEANCYLSDEAAVEGTRTRRCRWAVATRRSTRAVTGAAPDSAATAGVPLAFAGRCPAGHDDDRPRRAREPQRSPAQTPAPRRRSSPGLMPQRGERRHAGRRDEGPEAQARRQAAEVGGIVDRAARREAEHDVDQRSGPSAG